MEAMTDAENLCSEYVYQESFRLTNESASSLIVALNDINKNVYAATIELGVTTQLNVRMALRGAVTVAKKAIQDALVWKKAYTALEVKFKQAKIERKTAIEQAKAADNHTQKLARQVVSALNDYETDNTTLLELLYRARELLSEHDGADDGC